MHPSARTPSARSPMAVALALVACLLAGAVILVHGASARQRDARAHRRRHHPSGSDARARGAHRRARAIAHRRRGGGCRGANASAASTPLAEVRRAVLCLVNHQRTERGLPPLRPSRALERSAQAWTREMVRVQFFSSGSDLATRISAAGYSWRAAGENIAAGFATARAVVEGWMGSTGHCRNILDPQYANVGTGEIPSRLLGLRPAVWTQDFALHAGARAPSGDYGPMDRCPY
jgi:uncharacterized protein YkwD